jgi:hypothetical protein
MMSSSDVHDVCSPQAIQQASDEQACGVAEVLRRRKEEELELMAEVTAKDRNSRNAQGLLRHASDM